MPDNICKNKVLTQTQIRAAGLMLQGMSITNIAKSLGVSRQSVSTWKNQNELFKAELDKQKHMLEREVNDNLALNAVPLTQKLLDIALKSKNENTSLNAVMYALNRLCGTPTAKLQDVSDNKEEENVEDIDKIIKDLELPNIKAVK